MIKNWPTAIYAVLFVVGPWDNRPHEASRRFGCTPPRIGENKMGWFALAPAAISASGTLVGAFAGYKANSAKSSLAPTNNGGSDGTLLDAGTTLKRAG